MKKLFSLLLISILIISMFGCSNTIDVRYAETTIIDNNNNVTNMTTEETTQETSQKEQIETTTETENNEADDMESNNTLVAYFSATGTTKVVAEKIAEITNADLYEIVPSNPYSDADLNWHDNNSRSTKEMDDKNIRPEIGSSDIDLTKYQTIYLGYPIWWGDAPRIMSTFVEKYNFDGKTIIPFCTSGGSGIGRSGLNLKDLAGSGNWLNGERLSGNADTNSIENFINSNK